MARINSSEGRILRVSFLLVLLLCQ